MERKRIGERTREGMARIRATTGKHMGRSSVLADELVERIKADHAAGHSLNAIAKQLNAEAVPTATGKTWYASTVRGIVNR